MRQQSDTAISITNKKSSNQHSRKKLYGNAWRQSGSYRWFL